MDQLPTIPDINNFKRYYCYACHAEVRVTSNFTCVQCLGGYVEEIKVDHVTPTLTMLRQIETSVPNESNSQDNSNNNSITSSANISDLNESFASTSSSVNFSSGTSTTHTVSGPASGTVSESGTIPSTEVPPSTRGRTDNFRGAIMHVLMDVLDLLGSVDNNHNTAATVEPSAMATNTSRSRNAAFTDSFRSRFRDLLGARFSATDNRDTSNLNAWNTFFDFAFSSTGRGLSSNINPGNQTIAMGDPHNNVRSDEDLAYMLMNTLNRLLPAITRPTINDILQLIPKVEVTAEDLANQDICAICWDEFQLQESLRKLPCTHRFHERCVFPWLKLHRTCPLCRSCLSGDFGPIEFRDLGSSMIAEFNSVD